MALDAVKHAANGISLLCFLGVMNLGAGVARKSAHLYRFKKYILNPQLARRHAFRGVTSEAQALTAAILAARLAAVCAKIVRVWMLDGLLSHPALRQDQIALINNPLPIVGRDMAELATRREIGQQLAGRPLRAIDEDAHATPPSWTGAASAGTTFSVALAVEACLWTANSMWTVCTT